MTDASLWPVVVGGLLGMGGTIVGVIGTTVRDAAQQRHEKAKRRADKFEELVAAVYEYDHWLDTIRHRDAFGTSEASETVSPFAKVQSISAVYFPQFSEKVAELDQATTPYRVWIHNTEHKRVSGEGLGEALAKFGEALAPYAQARLALISALKDFARKEFQ